ncbi:TIGR03086 family metal-binding protein [Nocardia thailandica]|uniref:TIGR03086 family metal-binding protein n=1 Tax=Nocardia thailandica TaxID=257275 RepID=A0ABW6PRC0_9NOCA
MDSSSQTTDAAVVLAPVWKDVLGASHRALTAAVAGVTGDAWHAPTPCSEWNVTQVIQHAAGDQLAYAAALGVGTGPAEDPFAPSGSLTGSAADLVSGAISETAAAWATVTDDSGTVPTPLPHGALPTPVAAVLCALDAGVHAWDITVATGQPSPLTDELAAAYLTAATGLIEPLRRWGAYAAVVDPAPGDSTADTLLRYLGRDPRA